MFSGRRDYLAVADAIKDAERKLRTLDLGSAVVSQSVDALIETSGKVADNIGKAEARYQVTGDALSRYTPALEAAQRESAEALTLARSARSAADSASNDKQHYLRLAADEHDPRQALTYTNLADGLDSDAAGANAHLANAQGRVHDAISARDRAAQSAIDDVHAITKHDGLKDSWWDNWGKDLLSVITDVAGWVSSKAGVEIAVGQAEKLTVRQAIRLKPSELADSERLLAKPVADLKPGQTVCRVHGGDALPTGASYNMLPPSSMANPRSSLGLPRVNTGDNLIVATVDHVDNVVVTRHALPLNGQPGGAPGYIIPGPFGPSKGITVLSDTPIRLR